MDYGNYRGKDQAFMLLMAKFPFSIFVLQYPIYEKSINTSVHFSECFTEVHDERFKKHFPIGP
jgi:hypothetical protein